MFEGRTYFALEVTEKCRCWNLKNLTRMKVNECCKITLVQSRSTRWSTSCICPNYFIDRTGQGFVYIGSHSHRFTAVCLDSGVASWEVLLGDRIESSAAISLCEKFLIVGRCSATDTGVNFGFNSTE